MSLQDSSDDAILVEHETSVIVVEHGDDRPQIHSPSATTEFPESADDEAADGHMQQYNRPKTFRKLSNASSIISEIFHHSDTCEDRIRRKIKKANERDNAKDLIEFLRTTSPPPQNYMSVAYNMGEKREKKKRIPIWAICERLRARKGKKVAAKNAQPTTPPPALLMLPDSAVAGRTIGGHRYIAISIPVEHAHLGQQKEVAVVSRMRESQSHRSGHPSLPPASEDTGDSSESQLTSKPEPARQPSAADPLVGLHSATPAITSPKLTTLDEGFDEFSDFSVKDVGRHCPDERTASTVGYGTMDLQQTSGKGVLLKRRRSCWSWPAVSSHNSTREPVRANIHTYPAPPRLSSFRTRIGAAYDLGRGQSAFMFPDIEKALTSEMKAHRKSRPPKTPHLEHIGEESVTGPRMYDENDGVSGDTGGQPTQSLTADLPPVSRLPHGVDHLYHSPDTAGTSSRSTTTPEKEEALKFTPVMTVADVKPSLSMESIRGEEDDGDLTPRASVLQPALVPPDADTDTGGSREGRDSIATPPLGSLSIKRDRSLELLLARHPHLRNVTAPVRVQSPSRSSTDRSLISSPHEEMGRAVPRSDSHRELAQRYQELRETRDKDMSTLLDRLEQLEGKSDWWLNAVAPMVGNMTRSLSTRGGVYHDKDSLPELVATRPSFPCGRRAAADFAIASTAATTPLSITATASSTGNTDYLSCLSVSGSDPGPGSSFDSPPAMLSSGMAGNEQIGGRLGLFCQQQSNSFESVDSYGNGQQPHFCQGGGCYGFGPSVAGGGRCNFSYGCTGSRRGSFNSNRSSVYENNNMKMESLTWDDNIRRLDGDGSDPLAAALAASTTTTGHGMGVAVDRLPSRHGFLVDEFGFETSGPGLPLLNVTTPVVDCRDAVQRRQPLAIHNEKEEVVEEEDDDDVGGEGDITTSYTADDGAVPCTGPDWLRSDSISLGEGEEESANNGNDDGYGSDEHRETEWDTLEPLMRGLMETTRLDLGFGRTIGSSLMDLASREGIERQASESCVNGRNAMVAELE
ncbi:hypothetical protein B0H66DRAFT_85166 [Apodospora peruviana]|uniref:Uncharacterized protein n=1 Tax=Apodospora peruviana TaxID=516989 RepID=A0AAE0IU57_9PEZI|nr:hypothetical protein B0H66DRAFT_85166 [Apodospora peruviana]